MFEIRLSLISDSVEFTTDSLVEIQVFISRSDLSEMVPTPEDFIRSPIVQAIFA